jgi:hypothetical protein
MTGVSHLCLAKKYHLTFFSYLLIIIIIFLSYLIYNLRLLFKTLSRQYNLTVGSYMLHLLFCRSVLMKNSIFYSVTQTRARNC